MSSAVQPIIIIGAGVVGLTLAHGLKKAKVPFEVYERDAHIDARPHGWAITLHLALPFLCEMLDEATLAAVDAVQVDPDVERRDTGNFVFLNLETLEPKFRIPPNERRRVNREKLRKMLLRDVADRVRWGKRLVDVRLLGRRGVRARFDDGSVADGSCSRVRQFLVPHGHANHQLPVRLVGTAIDMTPAQVQSLRDIDLLLFQGCHPQTGHFLWISMLDTPATNGTRGSPAERYRVQVVVSWLVGDAAADQVPASDAARAAEMKRRAACFHPRLRAAVDAIPPAATVTEIALQDWPCRPWNNRRGRVTLVGDAAHAMTMYRGEAANHSILDTLYLARTLGAASGGRKTLRRTLDAFEAEMRERTAPAVLLSRQACLDAHDFDAFNENSAVLRRRAMRSP